MRQVVSKHSVIAVSFVAALAFVGGGIAHATTSSATIKVCVTSKNVVRSADAKGKCPKKTKAVAVNKVGPAGATGAQGAAGTTGTPGEDGQNGRDATQKLVASADVPDASRAPYSLVSVPGTYGAKLTISSVTFSVATAGFYSLLATSDVAGMDDTACNDGGDPVTTNNPEIYILADDEFVIPAYSQDRPSANISKWLEPGNHTFVAQFQQGGCLTNDIAGTVTFKNTHMRVYSN